MVSSDEWLIVLASFGLSLLAVWLGPRLTWLGRDAPGPRKPQTAVMPVVGALAIALPVAVLGRFGLVSAAAIVAAALLGMADDRNKQGFPWQLKLIGQVTIAGLWFVLAGAQNSAWVVPWLVLSMNAWNFLDNTDGVAGFTGLGAALPLLLQAGDAPAGAALTGALAGFLTRNWPRARVYMGDSGSHALGFALGVISIEIGSVHGVSALAITHAVVLIDMLQVVTVRLLHGIGPWQADRRHLAHRLARVLPAALVAPGFFVAQCAVGLLVTRTWIQ